MNELSYVFGGPLGSSGAIDPPFNYTVAEVALSEALIMYWCNFVKTGLVSFIDSLLTEVLINCNEIDVHFVIK